MRHLSHLLKHFDSWSGDKTVDQGDGSTSRILRDIRQSKNTDENPYFSGGTPKAIRKAMKRGLYPHFTGELPKEHVLRVSPYGMFVIPVNDIRRTYIPVTAKRDEIWAYKEKRGKIIRYAIQGKTFTKPRIEFKSIEVAQHPSLIVEKSHSIIQATLTMGYRWKLTSQLHTRDWVVADVLSTEIIDDIQVHKILAWDARVMRKQLRTAGLVTQPIQTKYAAIHNGIVSIANTQGRAMGGYTARVKTVIGDELWDL